MNFVNIDNLITLVLAIIMFGVGTSLVLSDLMELIKKKSMVLYGLLLQMLFLPLFAFFIVSLVDIPIPFKVGIMILSFCPGGATSNVISYLLDLKTALSVALTIANSLLILITIPLGVAFVLDYFVHNSSQLIDLSGTIGNLFFSLLLPVMLGMLLRGKWPDLIIKIKKPIKIFSTFLLGLVFTIKIFAGEQQGGTGLEWTEIWVILPIVLLVHLGSMLLSYFSSKWLKFEQFYAITIGIEVGLQNTVLALLISSVYLQNEEYAKPAIVYAMFSFFTTFAFGFLTKKFVSKHQPSN